MSYLCLLHLNRFISGIMSKVNDLLVSKSEKYISTLLSDKLPGNIIFHNQDYTSKLTQYAETIGREEGISEEEMNILRVSALFAGAGYAYSFENYNEESVRLSSEFLLENDVDQATIMKVAGIIRAIKLPQTPQDKLSEILCDADTMYLTAEDGIKRLDLLYDEIAWHTPDFVKRSAFEKVCIDRFMLHNFFTNYGKTVLQPKKETFIQQISERRQWRKLVESDTDKKNIFYSRGVETMFRVTARNQINLNSIADNKSNILISVNAIIISIIITMLVGNIRNMSDNILPVLVFLVICLVTVIIAILSTRPNIIRHKYTQEDLKNKNVDLTFFGNFDKMDYDDYKRDLKELMSDDDHLYDTLIKNQYSLGKILSKKFRLVRIAYNVFMIGIILTVIVFLMNFLFVNQG